MCVLKLYHVSSVGQGGEVQTHPEHEGLLACQIRYAHLCHGGQGRPVGPSPGGRHLHLPADASTDDSLRYSRHAEGRLYVFSQQIIWECVLYSFTIKGEVRIEDAAHTMDLNCFDFARCWPASVAGSGEG